MNTPIGIIGQGFVGTAVREGLRNHYSIMTYDKKQPGVVCVFYDNNEVGFNSSTNEVNQIVAACNFIFLCLPTPMKLDDSCDTSIIESVVYQIALAATSTDLDSTEPDPIIIIKSTVPPGTTARLAGQYPYLRFCFNPEFLTEANAIEDFKNQDRIVMGASLDVIEAVWKMYSKVFPRARKVGLDSTTAELVKYATNVFLSVRVSLANEFYQITRKLVDNDLMYLLLSSTLGMDQRIGYSHLRVPGPDGKRGFGGSCFPKDLNGLIAFARSLGIECPTMEGAWKTNLKVRPERDWEQLKGRAVVEQGLKPMSADVDSIPPLDKRTS